MSLRPYPEESNQVPGNVNRFIIPGLLDTPHRNQKFLIFPNVECQVRIALYKRKVSPDKPMFSIKTKRQATRDFVEHNVCSQTSPLRVEKEIKDGFDVYYLFIDPMELKWEEATWYIYVDITDGDQTYREKFGVMISGDVYAHYPHIASPNDSEFTLIRSKRS